MPFFTRKSFSASSTTLTSVTSTASDASTTTLLKPARPAKDFLAASGQLQSQYGFGGCAPTMPTVSSAPAKTKSAKAPSPKANASASTPVKGQKDFEAAYGALSSTYGFGGAPVAPTPRASK